MQRTLAEKSQTTTDTLSLNVARLSNSFDALVQLAKTYFSALPTMTWREMGKTGASFKNAFQKLNVTQGNNKILAKILYQLASKLYDEREQNLFAEDDRAVTGMSEKMQGLSQTVFGGVLIGSGRDPSFGLFLIEAKPEVMLSWNAAMAWAKSIGGDLPLSCELSVLRENLKEHFEDNHYWTKEQAPHLEFAWSKDLTNNEPTITFKQDKCFAVAIRREYVFIH